MCGDEIAASVDFSGTERPIPPGRCRPGWLSLQCKRNTFQSPRLAVPILAHSHPAVLADLDSYTNDIALGVGIQTGPSSEHPLARNRYRKSATDCRISHADARRCQHVMLHALPCLPCDRAAAPVAQPCCSAIEPNSYCSHWCRVDDRLTFTSPHWQPPPAPHRLVVILVGPPAHTRTNTPNPSEIPVLTSGSA